MDAKEFLQIAKDVLKSNKPANCRTAFNRSYYAAYNVAVNLLEAANIKISKSSQGHEDIRKYLGNCGIQNLKEAQQKLVNLSSDRIKADYRLDNGHVEKINNAKLAVARAENIIKAFDSYSSKSERKRITEGVTNYKQTIKSAAKKPNSS